VNNSISVKESFDMLGKVVIITGGAGLLGVQHAEAIAEFGGIPILWDIDLLKAKGAALKISQKYGSDCHGIKVDITQKEDIKSVFNDVIKMYKKVDGLINNAAINPKVNAKIDTSWSRFENFDLNTWSSDLAVGLTGAFLCSQVIGNYMTKNSGGVILNISSDLGIIAPDQRLYRKQGIPENKQPVKPVTYSIIKHGLIGLTKYLATYWAKENIRVNSLSPGGVFTNQPDEFLEKLNNLIPMGRMAKVNEYKAAIIFLLSEASTYMTGQNLIIDGGRTCW
jgi:NAD(P)-dependent dehydrogenase (short-subunit alcohol dehydrogenase family)